MTDRRDGVWYPRLQMGPWVLGTQACCRVYFCTYNWLAHASFYKLQVYCKFIFASFIVFHFLIHISLKFCLIMFLCLLHIPVWQLFKFRWPINSTMLMFYYIFSYTIRFYFLMHTFILDSLIFTTFPLFYQSTLYFHSLATYFLMHKTEIVTRA